MPEIYFIVSGEIKVYFNYETDVKKKEYLEEEEDEDEEANQIKRYFNKGYYFGDYNVLNDSPAEYFYVANSSLKTLALPKYKFIKLVDQFPEIKNKMKETALQYRKQLQTHMV